MRRLIETASEMVCAGRLGETVGRCCLPSWNSTARVNRSPGCPATIGRGLAQGGLGGQRSHDSMRGRRLAGHRWRALERLAIPRPRAIRVETLTPEGRYVTRLNAWFQVVTMSTQRQFACKMTAAPVQRQRQVLGAPRFRPEKALLGNASGGKKPV